MKVVPYFLRPKLAGVVLKPEHDCGVASPFQCYLIAGACACTGDCFVQAIFTSLKGIHHRRSLALCEAGSWILLLGRANTHVSPARHIFSEPRVQVFFRRVRRARCLRIGEAQKPGPAALCCFTHDSHQSIVDRVDLTHQYCTVCGHTRRMCCLTCYHNPGAFVPLAYCLFLLSRSSWDGEQSNQVSVSVSVSGSVSGSGSRDVACSQLGSHLPPGLTCAVRFAGFCSR